MNAECAGNLVANRDRCHHVPAINRPHLQLPRLTQCLQNNALQCLNELTFIFQITFECSRQLEIAL